MKLPVFLSKPRWQSKDVAVRRAGVAGDDDAALSADLARIAREDADAGVRLAAMKRLADPGIAQGLACDDADNEVRRQARALWLDLMAGVHPSSPPLEDRLRLLKAQDDAEVIEHAARHGRESEFRAAALMRVGRSALLLERALQDPDPGLRIVATERIDEEAALLRLAERARKHDKQVSRRARERVDELRLHRGDDDAVVQRARNLCERMEQLLREPQPDSTRNEIEALWSGIESRVDERLRQRYDTARALLAASLALPQMKPADELVADPVETAEAVEPVDENIEAPSADDPEEESPAPVDALLAQARFSSSVDHVGAAEKQQSERRRALLEQAERAVLAFETAVSTGTTAEAQTARRHLRELLRNPGVDLKLPRSIERRLSDAEQRYAELSRWQHWSDDQRRHVICEELEALANSGLHPDAIASRVREAQEEWKRLDAAEAREHRHGHLDRRFHAICRGALAPTQAYFRKRQELRESHAQEISKLLERIDAAATAEIDGASIVPLRREAATAMRDLDRVDPRERKALAQRLRKGLESLDARIRQHDAGVAEAKQKLIDEAAVLATDMPRGAIPAARTLQQRWQALGNGRRSRDQAQWKEFRAQLDTVFARVGAERAEREARIDEEKQRASSLCEDLEQLVDSTEIDRAAVTRIESAWNTMQVRDAGLRSRFEQALERWRAKDLAHRRAQRLARFNTWLERYGLCRDAETAGAPIDVLRERWQSAAATDIATDVLIRRFEAAIADAAATTTLDEDASRDVLIELETLSGLPSPTDEQDRRRALQVARLSARLGGVTRAPRDELADLLARWSALACPSPAADQRFRHALRNALETMD